MLCAAAVVVTAEIECDTIGAFARIRGDGSFKDGVNQVWAHVAADGTGGLVE